MSSSPSPPFRTGCQREPVHPHCLEMSSFNLSEFEKEPQTSLEARVLPHLVMTEIQDQSFVTFIPQLASFITATFSSLFLPTAAF